MKYFYVAIIAYLIGNISGSFLIGKLILDKDIRKYGSGNAGTTNAFRVMGKKYGILTFIIDFIKGIVSSYLIIKFFGKEYVPFSIFFCVLGHNYPFYMNFKGGKGMATTLGAFAFLNFKLTLIPYMAWVLGTWITKMVSVGSISFFVVSMIVFTFFSDMEVFNILMINLICLMGIYRHKSNIKRLINGTENKIGGKK
ncbi:MAG: glycerol-3-phosphate 1-O-acyltransferase PlsY [Tissierellia bacterium]|nr:glycerol-3-phosphate 1-O-acyltransferase PlsY [Tissierellia bacterium]